MSTAPYGVLYHTRYRRISGPPARPATREEWLDAMDEHGWPVLMIEAVVDSGRRTMAVVGGPCLSADPDPQPLWKTIRYQAKNISEILGVDPKEIMVNEDLGVILSPSQVQALLRLVTSSHEALRS